MQKPIDSSVAIQRKVSSGKSILLGLIIALVIAVILPLSAYKRNTDSSDRGIYKCAMVMKVLHKDSKRCLIDGEHFTLTQKIIDEQFAPVIAQHNTYIFYAGIAALLIFIIASIAIIKGLMIMEAKTTESTFLRGAQKTSAEELTRLLQTTGRASDITLGGVPIVAGSETTHFMVCGATGQGKGVAIKELLDTARAKGQRAIVYDPAGEFTEEYYQEGDILLNPFDARMPQWDLFSEMTSTFDFDDVVASLISKSPDLKETFWVDASRDVLRAALMKMAKSKEPRDRSYPFLYELIMIKTLKEIHEYLKGTEGAGYVDPDNEKTSMNVVASLKPAMKAFQYLKNPTGEKPPFSIKKFVANEEDDRWIFIRVEQSQLNALRPLLSLWFDLAITAALSLPIKLDRRLWFVIDEMATLQRIDKVKDALDKGRKYGVCTVLGMQALSQIKSIYGDNDSKSMITNCKTWIIYNTPDSETAKYLSENIGEEEILEAKASASESDSKDGTSNSRSVNYGVQGRHVVMKEEIMYLEPLHAYLKLAGDLPVALIKLQWKDRPKPAKKFIPA
jgi:type IV conjugative transfer system coupling protein TraD